MSVPYDEFEQYLSHYTHYVPPDGLKKGHIYILLTDDSPYGNMSVDYYDIVFADDSETVKFSYDLITKNEKQETTAEFEKYLGDILITIIIQSLNMLEEKLGEP